MDEMCKNYYLNRITNGFRNNLVRQGIMKLDVPTLEVIIDGVSEYKDLDEVKKYIQ